MNRSMPLSGVDEETPRTRRVFVAGCWKYLCAEAAPYRSSTRYFASVSIFSTSLLFSSVISRGLTCYYPKLCLIIYGGNLFCLLSPRIFKTGHFLDGFTSLSVYRSPNCPTGDVKSCAQECTGRFNPIASGGPCLKHLAQACTCVGTQADCPHETRITRENSPEINTFMQTALFPPAVISPRFHAALCHASARHSFSGHARTIARKTAVMLLVPEKHSRLHNRSYLERGWFTGSWLAFDN